MKRVVYPFKCKVKDFPTILAEKIKELEAKESEKNV